MRLTAFALAAGLAASPLLATPAHAAGASVPWTYRCYEGTSTRATAVVTRHCEAAPEVPVKGVVTAGKHPYGNLRLILSHYDRQGAPMVFRCAKLDLGHFPQFIAADGCAHDSAPTGTH